MLYANYLVCLFIFYHISFFFLGDTEWSTKFIKETITSAYQRKNCKFKGFCNLVLESINYNIYTSVVQLILTCGPFFNNARTVNQRLEQIKFQSCFWSKLLFIKILLWFQVLQFQHFCDIIFNVIFTFTGSFCSKMTISVQLAQNHTTS